MGLINAFIDCLDKKWGEQAMQRKIDEKDRRIVEKDRAIEALRKKKVELLRIREIRAKADAAWKEPSQSAPAAPYAPVLPSSEMVTVAR